MSDYKIDRVAHPDSRNDFSCELVRRRGSPLPSDATASNSSKGGAINRSRKLIGRVLLRLLTLFVALLTVSTSVVADSGCGSTVKPMALSHQQKKNKT